MKIAIDGPAGAGKSTVARLAAKKLGFIYVDTGAMYRAVALYILDNGIDVEDDKALLSACKAIDINVRFEDGTQRIYLNGSDVSDRIRKEEVGNMASKAAAKKAVRDKLLDTQRNIAKEHDVVMDGRDIGTFVLPDAELKIYLTASDKTRAKRRYDELKCKGENPDMEVILNDIRTRDYQDMNREIAPLRQADDAVFVDSSDMDIDEVTSLICGRAESL